MRYKKVLALYACLASLGVFVFRAAVMRPISEVSHLQSLKKQVARLEKSLGERNANSRPGTVDSLEDTQDLLLAILDRTSKKDCRVLSCAPSRRKSTGDCAAMDIDLAFAATFQDMLTALASIDSLMLACPFDASVTSCRIGAECSSDGKRWMLVCRQRLQCLPDIGTEPEEADWPLTVYRGPSPFHIPQMKVQASAEAPVIGSYAPAGNHRRPGPSVRYVGRIGEGRNALVIVETGDGTCLQLQRGDGVLLRDWGDSVKLSLQPGDTLVLHRK